MEHQIYLQRCIDLALRALGKTYPNPLVGCVIVHQNKIIGEGWHKKAGDAHAEINAINSVKNKELLKNSTMYVSLEPCSHYGKTPPCALKIIEMQIPRVVIGKTDPNELVNGKGIKLLQEANIEVIINTITKNFDTLNKRFNCFHQNKRPYIFLKWAETKDGFLDKKTYKDDIFWISNSLSKTYTHIMRANEQAILVGKNTVLKDNPSLTTREVEGKNPIRLVIDTNAELCENNFLIFDDNAKTYIFNYKLEKASNSNFWVKLDKNKNIITQILDFLFKNSIQSLIVEGGKFTLQEFINQNIWDEAVVISALNVEAIDGTKAPNLTVNVNKQIKLEDNIISIYKNTSSEL